MKTRLFDSTLIVEAQASRTLREYCKIARRIAVFVRSTLLIFALALSACSQATSTPALTRVTVQLSWFHQAEFTGFYAAEQLGYFAEEGLQVSFVEGGPEVDFIAPVVNGTAQFGVARQLKSQPASSPIPLVAVAALAMVGDRDRSLSAGFDGYITKPITPETFVGQVEVFLPSTTHPSTTPSQDATP